jgi:hypothetical protein
MDSTKNSKDSKKKKYFVDPEHVDNMIRLYNNAVDNLLAMSAGKCDPQELQYAMARAAGLLQAINYTINSMTEETKNGLTRWKTGQRTLTSTDCCGGACPEDRGTQVCREVCKNQNTAGGGTIPTQPQPKGSWLRRWRGK